MHKLKKIQENKKINWLLFFGILLIGANLRAPITSVGVALPSIKNDLSLSNTTVSFIAIVPLLSFSIISLLAAKTSNWIGLEKNDFWSINFNTNWGCH